MLERAKLTTAQKEIRQRPANDDICWEQLNVVLVVESVLLEAQDWVTLCEHCAENAATPFNYILDAITDSDPTMTEYLMCRPARCPQCDHEVTEKTLVVVN